MNATSKRHLRFLFDIGKKKPNSIVDHKTICPFCDRDNLTDIISEQGDFILLKNKFMTLEDTVQTVLIETNHCQKMMDEYEPDYMRALITFAFEQWEAMKASDEFKSVLFYKNHGPNSGGTIKHSHMQLVGLKEIDYRDFLKEEYFEGITIYENHLGKLNLSSFPHIGFTEFNVTIQDAKNLDFMADQIQKIVHYILNHFYVPCDSFNLFFYEWQNQFICKIVPRFVTSPLYIGFSISQVSNQLERIVSQIQGLYYE